MVPVDNNDIIRIQAFSRGRILDDFVLLPWEIPELRYSIRLKIWKLSMQRMYKKYIKKSKKLPQPQCKITAKKSVKKQEVPRV